MAVADSPARPSASFVPFAVEDDAIHAALAGLTGNATRGRTLVLDRRHGNCLICHALPSIDEPFQGDIGPSLAGVGGRLSRGQIRLRLIDQSVLNPDTLMPPYYRIAGLTDVAQEFRGSPALSAQDIEDVIAYLASLTH